MPLELMMARPRRCSGKISRSRPIPVRTQNRSEPSFSLHSDPWCDDYYDEQSGVNEGLRDLLAFKKWWFMRNAEIVVNGETLCGMTIFHWGDSIRVINESHSYFIPLKKIDYIRTGDGYGERGGGRIREQGHDEGLRQQTFFREKKFDKKT